MQTGSSDTGPKEMMSARPDKVSGQCSVVVSSGSGDTSQSSRWRGSGSLGCARERDKNGGRQVGVLSSPSLSTHHPPIIHPFDESNESILNDDENQHSIEDIISDEVHMPVRHASNPQQLEGENQQHDENPQQICGDNAFITMQPETAFRICERPKPKSYVSIKMYNQNWFDASVLSYQPKKNSAYNYWLNIQMSGEDSPKSINWTHVEEWKHKEAPITAVYLTKSQEADQDIVDAKFDELEKLKKNEVFEEVPNTGQRTISSRWVFTEKLKEGKKVVKARLVARGFEENSEELGIRTDSPTCSRHSLRLVMLTAASKGWNVKSIDVASAFLQGNPIQRERYIRPPKELCDEHTIWKLKRCLYGLNDAPREWYNKVYGEFIESGAVRSTLDNAMFMWYKNDEIVGHLVSHVDDFNYAGTDEWLKEVMHKVKNKFNISSESDSSFTYLGLNVNQDQNAISIDQMHYIEKLQEIPMSSERRKQNDEILSKEEKSQLRSLSGQMLWVTSQTRPDSAFETCMMSNPGKSPTIKLIKEANKAVRKMRNSNDVKIKFPSLGVFKNMEVIVHGDASYASLTDGSSQGASITFIKGEGKMAPLLWKSRKLKRVTKSPLASEILAVGEASDAGILIANIMKETYKLQKLPNVTCYTDSKSMIDNLKSSNTIDDMSIRVEVARMREMVNLKEIKYLWVNSKNNLADVMTKRTASSDALLQVLDSGTC